MKRPKLTGKRVEVYKARDGGFRFRAYARNGRQVGKSEESFRRRNYAYKNAAKEFPGYPIYNEKGELWNAAVPLEAAPEKEEETQEASSAELGDADDDSEAFTGSRADA